jgi:hypothetical protein
MKFLPPTTAFLVLAVLMHTDVRAQDSSAPPPEMKVLERLVGTWRVENIGKVPEETRSTSITKRELVLGGRFVQETGGPEKGKPTYMCMQTYDSNRKTYRGWFFHESGSCSESTGTWDESSQTFTFTNRPGGGAMGVTTLHFLDEKTLDFSWIVKDKSGKISFQMEAKAVRQK